MAVVLRHQVFRMRVEPVVTFIRDEVAKVNLGSQV